MKAADQLDLAAEYEAQNLQHALDAQKLSRQPELPEIGRCYNCDAPLEHGLFCPPFESVISECMTDWQTRRRAQAMRPRHGA